MRRTDPSSGPAPHGRPARRFGFEPTVLAGDARGERPIDRQGRDPAAAAVPDSAGRGGRRGALGGAPQASTPRREPICRLEQRAARSVEIALAHSWPVREPRPVSQRLPIAGPMITGQRILDTLFPVGRGSRAALPGGFGTGKTILQQALAKWSDADIIVYVGCGERGNEMAEVLDELPKLEDPRTGRPLMERTVIIANTSNMPVAAREASIYTAITVAEYFRDQGLHVALMADSTSRWAEACEKCRGRLGELPGEAGYPAYLSSRLAQFYERAGRVSTLGRRAKARSRSSVRSVRRPAISTEPVTMHTRRCVRTFWALDRGRAQARFFPAIHPLQSYSADVDALARWWQVQGNPDWSRTAQAAARASRGAGAPRAHGAHRRQGCPAAGAAADVAVRRSDQRRGAAPVVLFRYGSVLFAAAVRPRS